MGISDLRPRVAALELDLRDRDQEIRQLRQEYERQREQAERQRIATAAMEFESLARQLVQPLSQLVTMRAFVDTNRVVRVEDILKLFDKLEQSLIKSGLSRIGTVGATVPFDSRLHQRMSGLDPHDGDLVTVRFVGYRLSETILLKAMVSHQNCVAEPSR